MGKSPAQQTFFSLAGREGRKRGTEEQESRYHNSEREERKKRGRRKFGVRKKGDRRLHGTNSRRRTALAEKNDRSNRRKKKKGRNAVLHNVGGEEKHYAPLPNEHGDFADCEKEFPKRLPNGKSRKERKEEIPLHVQRKGPQFV